MTRICCIQTTFKVKGLLISKDTMMLLAIGEKGKVFYWKLQDQTSSIRLNLQA